VIDVVVADDDPRIRTDFSTLLGLEDDLRVVAVAADGVEAVRLCTELSPDVVVMDVRMPRVDGIDATRALRARPGATARVLVVTTFDLDDYVLGAIRAGASGFILKDQAPDHLAAAVRVVAAGDAIVSPRATARLLQELVPPRALGGGVLTPREVEVVRLVARGAQQRGDRPRERHLARNREDPRQRRAAQARAVQPHRGRRVGLRARGRAHRIDPSALTDCAPRE
jgi:DNA-binding NarL/FixJ family response regulator